MLVFLDEITSKIYHKLYKMEININSSFENKLEDVKRDHETKFKSLLDEITKLWNEVFEMDGKIGNSLENKFKNVMRDSEMNFISLHGNIPKLRNDVSDIKNEDILNKLAGSLWSMESEFKNTNQNFSGELQNLQEAVIKVSTDVTNLSTHNRDILLRLIETLESVQNNIILVKEEIKMNKNNLMRFLQYNLTLVITELLEDGYKENKELKAIKEINQENKEIAKNKSEKLLKIDDKNTQVMSELQQINRKMDQMVTNSDKMWTTSRFSKKKAL